MINLRLSLFLIFNIFISSFISGAAAEIAEKRDSSEAGKMSYAIRVIAYHGSCFIRESSFILSLAKTTVGEIRKILEAQYLRRMTLAYVVYPYEISCTAKRILPLSVDSKTLADYGIEPIELNDEYYDYIEADCQ